MLTASLTSPPAPARRPVHLFLLTLLMLPQGMAYGYILVAMGYVLARAGVPVGQIAALAAASLLPYIFKFLWAPLVDTTLTFKKWYGLSVGAGSLVLMAMSLLPLHQDSLPLLTLGVYAMQFCFTFSGMATAGLMAYEVPAVLQGRASGLFTIGTIGGTGLGGGVGLLLAHHLPVPGLAGVVLGVLFLGCIPALRPFRDQPTTIHAEKMTDTYRALGRDVWATVSSRSGWLGLVICVMPFGCATAAGLWSSVASEWHAGADTVALVTGLLAAVVSTVGCLAGGWVCDRVNPRYFTLAVAMAAALSLVGMAYAPRTEALFITGTLLYALLNGMGYAGSATFILEAIGQGAAATKYNLFASLSNVSAYVMTMAMGMAYTHFGSVGMLNTEFVFGVGSLVVYVVVQRVALRGHIPGWRKQVAAPEPLQAALLAG